MIIFFIQEAKFNYGKKDKNPMLEHYFYTKRYPDHPFTLSEEEVWLVSCIMLVPLMHGPLL